MPVSINRFPNPVNAAILAVYGSLRRRHPAKLDFAVRKHMFYVGQGWIRGMLVWQNEYPAALENQPGTIAAELFRVYETNVLTSLDRYEGCMPEKPRHSLFYRKLVPLQQPRIWAWVYFLGSEIPRGAPCISPNISDRQNWGARLCRASHLTKIKSLSNRSRQRGCSWAVTD
ncbi:MAG: gamma-glutamylcyclotransferase [Verrucomicrobia bacterium]|nr:gamma-glutamylcyclotransferase [Verrucomicrobiota bacterium]